jgi:DMSO reductase anchor subunit
MCAPVHVLMRFVYKAKEGRMLELLITTLETQVTTCYKSIYKKKYIVQWQTIYTVVKAEPHLLVTWHSKLK